MNIITCVLKANNQKLIGHGNTTKDAFNNAKSKMNQDLPLTNDKPYALFKGNYIIPPIIATTMEELTVLVNKSE